MPEQTADVQQQPPAGAASKSLADVVEMASLRWQLAELEVHSDLVAAKRFGWLGGAGLVAAIAAVSVLTVALTGHLNARMEASFPWVTLSAGCLMLAGGVLVAWWSWRRFRGEFLGLRESLEECREDLVWLREWAEDRP